MSQTNMGEGNAARHGKRAAVIPLRPLPAEEPTALERAVVGADGRGRAVLLVLPWNADVSALLREARALSSDAHLCEVVQTRMCGADELALRILAPHCLDAPKQPRALLRAWLAHLAANGREVAIVLEDPGGLPVDTAQWLGAAVRASGGAARLVAPATGDRRVWRVVEELGLETETVEAPAAPLRAEATPVASVMAGPARPSDPPPRRDEVRLTRSRLLAVRGLVGLGLLALGALWWQAVANVPSEPSAPAIATSVQEQAQWPVAAAIGDRAVTNPSRMATAPEPVPREPEDTSPTVPPRSTNSAPSLPPEPTPGSLSLAEEVERAIAILLDDGAGDRRVAIIDRLLTLDPERVSREVVYQFDQLQPVGPIEPARVDEAWESLRSALCASRPDGGAPDVFPPELGCRPSR